MGRVKILSQAVHWLDSRFHHRQEIVRPGAGVCLLVPVDAHQARKPAQQAKPVPLTGR